MIKYSTLSRPWQHKTRTRLQRPRQLVKLSPKSPRRRRTNTCHRICASEGNSRKATQQEECKNVSFLLFPCPFFINSFLIYLFLFSHWIDLVVADFPFQFLVFPSVASPPVSTLISLFQLLLFIFLFFVSMRVIRVSHRPRLLYLCFPFTFSVFVNSCFFLIQSLLS